MNKKTFDSETETIVMINSLTSSAGLNHKVPSTHLKWSIVNLISSLFCLFGLFFSMFAFNNSFKTQNDIESGNLRKARQHSKMAKKFNIIITSLSLFGLIIYLLIFSIKMIQPVKKTKITPKFTTKTFDSENFFEINITRSIIGFWKMETSENFEAYLTEIKADYFIKKFIDLFYPIYEFKQIGEKWQITGSTSIKAVTSNFKMNEEFNEEIFGLQSISLFKLDKNRFYKTQKHKNKTLFSWITFEVNSEDKLLNVFNANDVTAVRTFKRVDYNEYD